jgi:hypothetical protein
MGEILDAAFEKLQNTGEPDVVRERIAMRTMAAAKRVIRLACWQPRSAERTNFADHLVG